MSKDLSARYYKKNRERLQKLQKLVKGIMIFLRKKQKERIWLQTTTASCV